ncbi:MAG: hypothetical protein WCJ89_04950, partial [Actinomycetes bacterium]
MTNLLSSYKKTARLRQESRWGTGLVNLWLIFFAVVSIVPMIWLLLAPTKTDPDLTNKNPLM